jgi:thioredoxin 2
MSKMLKCTCLDCGAVGRFPLDKIKDKPKCGKCGSWLITGKVWQLDPATLAKAAKNDDLPLVVDFWAPWCGPCRMMAPQFEMAAGKLAPYARFAKINTEDHAQISGRYNIRGIPMLALFKGGREVARQAGAMQAPQIQAWVGKNSG